MSLREWQFSETHKHSPTSPFTASFALILVIVGREQVFDVNLLVDSDVVVERLVGRYRQLEVELIGRLPQSIAVRPVCRSTGGGEMHRKSKVFDLLSSFVLFLE
jgi:hypothetical protein